LIDELESLLDDDSVPEVDNVDVALNTHKEAARYGEAMLACQQCAARVENMTLVSVLAERLVRVCEGMVSAYLNGMKTPSSENSSKQVVCFGEYELDSPIEWDLLFGNAVILQLRTLHSLVDRIGGKKHIQGPRVRILATIRALWDRVHVARNVVAATK
jgi:hypothetical protein